MDIYPKSPKSASTSWAIRGMKIKTTLRYQLTPIRMATVMDNSSTGEDVEKLGPSHTAGRNVNGTSGTTLKKSLAVLK